MTEDDVTNECRLTGLYKGDCRLYLHPDELIPPALLACAVADVWSLRQMQYRDGKLVVDNKFKMVASLLPVFFTCLQHGRRDGKVSWSVHYFWSTLNCLSKVKKPVNAIVLTASKGWILMCLLLLRHYSVLKSVVQDKTSWSHCQMDYFIFTIWTWR